MQIQNQSSGQINNIDLNQTFQEGDNRRDSLK